MTKPRRASAGSRVAGRSTVRPFTSTRKLCETFASGIARRSDALAAACACARLDRYAREGELAVFSRRCATTPV